LVCRLFAGGTPVLRTMLSPNEIASLSVLGKAVKPTTVDQSFVLCPHCQQHRAQVWGLDHGTWSVLKPMFPAADIPVLQLSMDYARPPAEHYALGQQLRALRERGVLIVGSGNVVHNLRAARRGTGINAAYEWANEFDVKVQELVKAGGLDALVAFQQWGPMAPLAHPTHEHYLPLLYAAGAALPTEMPRFFNTGFQSASISMRSMLWG